ncbi:O-methylsterigmatocystin oxidoreductase [Ceratobasidium theobromae]|uniref:O-methylsterigmatocystin oxidoreductase n=1 Tax=Ceratobasidium theobromae TaxID=1582974 RepID=A0A5N5QG39_9AGAM|nr:O-methylsterigmatocystin oxidoreductase [Ceratobasidium theobromae]
MTFGQYSWEGLLLLAGIGLLVLRRRANSKKLPLPPSPPPYFLLGNLKDLPNKFEWLGFEKISKNLQSDITSFSILGKTIIVLNSHRAVSDLLEKRANYADRPWIPMIHDPDLMDLGGAVSLSPYGPRWRQLRKAIHLDMQESVIPRYWPSLQAEAQRLVVRLSENGGSSLVSDIRHWVAAFLLSATYGYHLPKDSPNDPLLQRMIALLEAFTNGFQSSRFLVNVFPMLKYLPEWMPGGSFHEYARQGRELGKSVRADPFNKVKREMAEGIAQPSYVSRMLSEIGSKDKKDLSGGEDEDSLYYEDLIRQNAAATFGAGFDTTVASLSTFFIAMQLYPEVQSRAREEVLGVIDPSTGWPNPADVVNLPYLRNLLRELLRWIPSLPLGLAHAALEEDEYKGFRIPAKSIVVPNVWAITRDESVYPDPEVFNPDRFLDSTIPHEIPFGFGRRRCPGMHLANANLAIVIAYILTAFEISNALNLDGSEIKPSLISKDDPQGRPEPKCTLRARNPSLLAELKDE